jgi:hypothetical protein
MRGLRVRRRYSVLAARLAIAFGRASCVETAVLPAFCAVRLIAWLGKLVASSGLASARPSHLMPQERDHSDDNHCAHEQWRRQR